MATIIQDKPLIVRSEKNHKEYTLYKTVLRLRNEQLQTIFFFSNPDLIKKLKNRQKYKTSAFPAGYKLYENEIGSPYLQRAPKNMKVELITDKDCVI